MTFIDLTEMRARTTALEQARDLAMKAIETINAALVPDTLTNLDVLRGAQDWLDEASGFLGDIIDAPAQKKLREAPDCPVCNGLGCDQCGYCGKRYGYDALHRASPGGKSR